MAYPRASQIGGQLETIKNCYLKIPKPPGNGMTIEFQAMPTVTDGKTAKYDATPIIGRATPLLTYANSETRTISADLPFFVTKTLGDGIGTVQYNLQALRAIASACYPRKPIGDVTYQPPVVCKFRFGDFLAVGSTFGPMCVIIDKYSVKNDPSVPSDPETLCPYKFIVNVNMIKVYSSEDLPNQDSIWEEGV